MYDRRQGTPDRRASKRGGRRATDAMRSDVDTLRLEWEDPGMSAGSPGVSGRGAYDETIAGGAERSPADRLVPPRK